MSPGKKKKFEDYLSEVEEVVKALEQGQLTLDESLTAYESGRKALEACQGILADAEKKVEILLSDEKGERRGAPFEEEKGEE